MGLPANTTVITATAAAKGISERGFESPNSFQTHTIIAALVMILVAGIFWNAPILRDAVAGIRLLVVGTHEMFHLLAGIVCGGTVVTVCIDPNAGGATHIMGLMRTVPRVLVNPYATASYGKLHWSAKAVITLLMGYVGSSIIGFLYVFCAFDIVASKIASFTIAITMLVPLVRADTVIPFVSVFCLEVLLIGLWFGDHGSALRFYVLLVGIFNLFYPVWDYIDERVFDKPNTSDCTQFSDITGQPAPLFFVSWVVYDCLVFVAAIFAGVIVFRKDSERMYRDAAAFLPT